ncbi:hypothetical protein F0U59_26165 [Archangium gephyra]|nr:hypothetical protein F0U59_26165 [Archangium gephyra]
MPLSLVVTQEFYSLFGDNPDFMNDEHYNLFIEIACFLGDTTGTKRQALTTAFEQLEAELQSAKRQRHQSSQPLPKPTWEKDRDSHLLSSTLTRFEQEQGGFNVVRDDKWWELTKKERARLYLSFVRADRFRHLLTTGYHWKDPTVSPGHGEFTHRLQWYALVAGGVLDKNTAVPVMRKCGLYVRDNPPANKKGVKVPTTDLWEVLFDRDSSDQPNSNFLYPSVDSDLDFRNPNNLNTFLRENASLPFLSSFLTARYNKRQKLDQNAYVAKKQFGKQVDQLSEKEKILLYGIVLDGVAGANGVDAFAQEISKMISIEEGEKNTPNISVIKSVLNKSYPLPYK